MYQSNGVTVTAFLVDHDPVAPAFGYRVDYGGHSVAISGDTRPNANLVEHAQGVGCPGPRSLQRRRRDHDAHCCLSHTSRAAADIFNRVAPRLAVYSHLAPASSTPQRARGPRATMVRSRLARI